MAANPTPPIGQQASELMARIREQWGANIRAAVTLSSIPEAFLAAIVANESGGAPGDTRFESAVFGRLVNVCAGLSAVFSPHGVRRPLTAPWLLAYASPGELQPAETVAEMSGPPFGPFPPGAPARGLQWGLKRLRELATSYGLTQVMGWHLVEMAGMAGWRFTVGDLLAPASNLKAAVLLLSYFVEHYQLDPAKEFSELLYCWNTGLPDGSVSTFDPRYVPNGLERMAAYAALPPLSASAPAPPAPTPAAGS